MNRCCSSACCNLCVCARAKRSHVACTHEFRQTVSRAWITCFFGSLLKRGWGIQVIKKYEGNTGFMSGNFIHSTFTSVALFLYNNESCLNFMGCRRLSELNRFEAGEGKTHSSPNTWKRTFYFINKKRK